ncbi:MAG: hypothetical protein M1814_006228 [Vezdaea aestivalis]|nr:MAG: hypothetical protein M1814_006228 [Vezdaea aestivalis]
MAAFVRVSGPPNSNFLVGYPGISATLPRIEGKVEIRPAIGATSPVSVSLITISLIRKESIHAAADSVKKRLSAPRKDLTDIVGKEMLLFRCPPGRESDNILSMDLPFILFIPYGKGGEESSRRVPPASIQLDKRTVETCYELVVMVQQGHSDQRKYAFPVPIQRYDTLSSFGMYNRPETAERITDHLVTLGISIPRWSYGPLDPVSVYIKLSPNPDWKSKAKKVTVQKITVAIEEEITYNHEGDEPLKKVKNIVKNTTAVGSKLPEEGYFVNLGLVFPSKEMRSSDGVMPRAKPGFPMYLVTGFTTTASLYKIEYFLTVKAQLNAAKDIYLRQPITVCPLDHPDCNAEMDAIEQAAKDASHINADNPMLPAATIIRPHDHNSLHCLGMTMVGRTKKLLID